MLRTCLIVSLLNHVNVILLPREAKKTAPFYFCNSFVRTSSIATIFGTHILQ